MAKANGTPIAPAPRDTEGRPADRVQGHGRQLAPLRIATVEGTEWWLGVGRACAMSAERRRCFQTPGRKVTGVRRVHGSWWLLTEQGIYEPGPAYRVDGDTAKAAPDDTLSVSDVVDISGATWLVTKRNGKPAPLQRVN